MGKLSYNMPYMGYMGDERIHPHGVMYRYPYSWTNRCVYYVHPLGKCIAEPAISTWFNKFAMKFKLKRAICLFFLENVCKCKSKCFFRLRTHLDISKQILPYFVCLLCLAKKIRSDQHNLTKIVFDFFMLQQRFLSLGKGFPTARMGFIKEAQHLSLLAVFS